MEVHEECLLKQLKNYKDIHVRWITLQEEDAKIHFLSSEKHESNHKEEEKRPILILIHGANSGSCSFAPSFRELSKYFQVYALDLPGFGFSDTPVGLQAVKTAKECQDWYALFLKHFVETMFPKRKVNRKRKHIQAVQAIRTLVSMFMIILTTISLLILFIRQVFWML